MLKGSILVQTIATCLPLNANAKFRLLDRVVDTDQSGLREITLQVQGRVARCAFHSAVVFNTCTGTGASGSAGGGCLRDGARSLRWQNALLIVLQSVSSISGVCRASAGHRQ